jgi:prepilin-type N-terminal cleavage/methylation domain-containing protein
VRRKAFTAAAPPPLPAGEARADGAARGFSLVELLVVISIILVMMAIAGAAVSSARDSSRKAATRAMIMKLDSIISQQLSSYSNRHVPADRLGRFPTIGDKTAAAAWYVRRHLINADLPDRWTDVAYMAEKTDFQNPTIRPEDIEFPAAELTAAQKAYIGFWNARQPKPTAQHAGAECLFMIVMQGGIAGCLTCDGLSQADVGDFDNDGAPEFLDAWGRPIEYILWPAAVELPPASGTRFFSEARAPFAPIANSQFVSTEDANGDGVLDAAEDTNQNGRLDSVSPTLGLRPLIYSAGPDKDWGLNHGPANAPTATSIGAGNDPPGRDCGNWMESPCSEFGAPATAGYRSADDNITNFDLEAAR